MRSARHDVGNGARDLTVLVQCAFRRAHAGRLSLGQLKVMSAIEACRTAVMGGPTVSFPRGYWSLYWQLLQAPCPDRR